MRAEQDRAYAEAGKRDVERIRAKQAELDAEKSAKERKLRELQESETKATNAALWRIYAQRHLVPAEPTSTAGKTCRLSVKLPDGRRLVRKFAADVTVEQIYTWVDCEAFSFKAPSASSSPSSTATTSSPPVGYQHRFEFELATLFPKRTLPFDECKGRTASEAKLVPDASLVVEGMKMTSVDGGDGRSSEEEAED